MNQDLLKSCYSAMNKQLLLGTLSLNTEYNFSGYISRLNHISGKLAGEFHLKGTYYGYYGEKKPESREGVEISFVENEKAFVIDTPYDGFHHHFLVSWVFREELSIIGNKLCYNSKAINKDILEYLNEEATKYFLNNYSYIYEKNKNTNNFIVLK